MQVGKAQELKRFLGLDPPDAARTRKLPAAVAGSGVDSNGLKDSRAVRGTLFFLTWAAPVLALKERPERYEDCDVVFGPSGRRL